MAAKACQGKFSGSPESVMKSALARRHVSATSGNSRRARAPGASRKSRLNTRPRAARHIGASRNRLSWPCQLYEIYRDINHGGAISSSCLASRRRDENVRDMATSGSVAKAALRARSEGMASTGSLVSQHLIAPHARRHYKMALDVSM